ncbi:type II CRISPR-associated endonuclease Cas1 [Weissella kandleri]|nr:type II CRISPR-associated endonuclease Cas1 [Weissella kandleri]
MSFRTIYITKHSKVSYKMNLILVKTNEDIIKIPVDDINILIFETPQIVITGVAIMEMVKRNVRIIFSNHKGMPVGEVNSYYGNAKRNLNIKEQIDWSGSKKGRLWQIVVKEKLLQQKLNLQGCNLDTTGFDDLINDTQLGDQTNREAVGARMYFRRLYGNNFVRQDMDNDLNIKLNYGYQILLAAVTREINHFGYLTELGIHHDNATNEYNLASDLMEPLRPLIDRIVYNDLEIEFNTAFKIKMVNVLNQEIKFNHKSMLVATAVHDMVRLELQALSEDGEIELGFEL